MVCVLCFKKFFLLSSTFGNDVYAVSEDMFEDVCVWYVGIFGSFMLVKLTYIVMMLQNIIMYIDKSVRENGHFCCTVCAGFLYCMLKEEPK